MRIGIEMNKPPFVCEAIKRYGHNLFKELLKIDNENFYILFSFSNQNRAEMKRSFKKTTIRFDNLSSLRSFPPVWEKNSALINKACMAEKIDLFHSTGWMTCDRINKRITTFHDIFPMYLPFYPQKVREWFAAYFARGISRADTLIAVSEFTKKDILRLLDVPAYKIKVVYPGVEKRFRPIQKSRYSKQIFKKYSISPPYIIFIGDISNPRKNVLGLLRAFSKFKKETLLPHQLVIGGFNPNDLGVAYVLKWCIKRFKSNMHDIRMLNLVPESELPILYAGADLLLHPSFGEGFGLTLLEAMACGLPVVTSRNSAIPEVVGDAGIYVNPYDVNDISNGVLKILLDETLRGKLIEGELKRVKKFSWERTARATLKVYEELYK